MKKILVFCVDTAITLTVTTECRAQDRAALLNSIASLVYGQNSVAEEQSVALARNILPQSKKKSRKNKHAKLIKFYLPPQLETCSQGGQSVVSSSATARNKLPTNFRTSISSTLNNCNGLTGTSNIYGSGNAYGKEAVINLNYKSTISMLCGSEYAEFKSDYYLIFGFYIKPRPKVTSHLISGNIQFNCGAVSVSCNWSNVDTNDFAAFTAGCH